MGYLYITGGSIRNRKIIGPQNMKTRPMQAFLRKTMFDLMPLSLDNAIIWDIFAGSGAIGLEALSRGARKVFFIERDPKMVEIIGRNMKLCGFQEKSQILLVDYFELKRWVPKVEPAKFIFLDPPFSINPAEVLEKLYNLFELVNKSLIIIRFSKRPNTMLECPFYKVILHRIYGDSVLMFGRFE
ncbi:MAG: hypothetical protein GX428_05860 [Candidatus Atribacteria bacterium]|nr:hypothetical protein [Candidatus Atribacteria bacterium]